jgi:hypothetical protein
LGIAFLHVVFAAGDRLPTAHVGTSEQQDLQLAVMNDHQHGLGQFISGVHGESGAKLWAGQGPKHFAPEGPWPVTQTAMGQSGYFDGTLGQVFLNTKKCLFDNGGHTII